MQDPRPTWRVLVCAMGLPALPTPLLAGDIAIEVLDRDGAPVPEVAVFALPVGGGTAEVPRPDTEAEISQSDLAFHPHLLIVETGTSVRFPNDDDVRHHVYSFSDAKRFDLTIDSGSVTTETFETAGVVTLGCNIHDDMLAYVLVVDTPHFAKTESLGTATLTAVPAGRYEVHVFTPRLPGKALPEPVWIDLPEAGSEEISFQLEKKLYPPHEHSETSLHWSHY